MKLIFAFALLPLAVFAADSRSPVIVELFTSEGCSSCPSADKLLAQIERTQPVPNAQVLVLSEHVDYWNRLGWRDPFSTHGFSERQSAYADAFRKEGVYTPQMVVDGQTEFVGSNDASAKKAIAEAAQKPKALVTVTGSDKLTVNVEQVPGAVNADVLLAITESGLRSDVRSGENSGRQLNHTGVVRQLTVLGQTHSGSFSAQASPQISADWNRANLQVVVFVQDRKTKRILGAASLKL
jgi:hypothetical protein